MTDLKVMLERRCGQVTSDHAAVAVAISRVPYGRPSTLTAAGVVEEWRGTCSTKHMLFAEIVRAVWPDLRAELWHRPYLVTRELAEAHWGHVLLDVVPSAGLVDVHTFATIQLRDQRVFVDVTFPLSEWDGISDTPLACGSGSDYPAGDDPLASKAKLVSERCDPAVREPFIAALARQAA